MKMIEKYLCPVVLVVVGVMSAFFASAAAATALEGSGLLAPWKYWIACAGMTPAGIFLPIAAGYIIRSRQ